MDEVRRNVADIRSEGAVGSFPVGYYLTGLAADEETFSTAGVVVLPDEFVVVDTDLERDDRWEIGRIPRTGTVTSVKPLPEGAAVPNLKAGEKPKEPDLEEEDLPIVRQYVAEENRLVERLALAFAPES